MSLVNFFISVAGIICLTMRHSIKSQWLNLYLPKELRKNTIVADIHDDAKDFSSNDIRTMRSPFRFSFWCEVLVFMIVPMPFYNPIISFLCWNLKDNDGTKVNVYYLLSDLILAFMFIRIYFLIRVIFNYSKYSDDFSRKIAHHHGISANMRYAFKARLTRYPG